MPLVSINATSQAITLHSSPQSAERRLRQLAQGSGPIIIMIHGYKYHPGLATHCPHETLFSQSQTTGWSQPFLAQRNEGQTPLVIGFGWYARGRLRDVHQRARGLGRQLACLVAMLSHAAPNRPVHLITHSMGSEVALSALPHLRAGQIHRAILLTGASHQSFAKQMLLSEAGKTLELLNIVTRENDIFDLGFERIVPPGQPRDGAIGRGIEAQNALTVQLDCGESLQALSGIGHDIAPPDQRISHWSTYLRPGAMAFYAHALHAPERLPLEHLRSILPDRTEPHLSRLWSARIGAPLRMPLLRPSPLVLSLKKRIMGPGISGGATNEHAH